MKKYVILSLLIQIVIATMIFFIFFTNENAKKKIKKDAYRGIITDIFRDSWDNEKWVFTVKVDSLEREQCVDHLSYSWEYACVGDSIIKPLDTSIIIIKKPNGESKEFVLRPR